jgi:hypothetical protein
MTQNQSQTSLSAFAAAMRDPDPDAAWEFAKKLWNESGVAVFVLSDVERKSSWSTSRQARNIAEDCYGKRAAKGL